MIPDEFVYSVAVAGTPYEVGKQLQRVFPGDADEIMAYLLVPTGETFESVLELTAAAEASSTSAPTVG